MILADRIRAYVVKHYIDPAKAEDRTLVSFRAGDVHKEMGLYNRMPAVCGAIDAEKFKEIAGVQLLERTGPHQGSNAVWVFKILRT